MRVLVAHNFYRSSAPSGENQLVRAEVALLREGGVEVVEMFEDSDTIPGGVARRPPCRARSDLLAVRRTPFQAAPGHACSPTWSTSTRSRR